MIVGYAIPAVQKFQGAAYKSLYYQALVNSKADGATPDDNPCLIARGDELYRAGVGAVPSVLIVPQFVKPGAVYTQIPTPTVEAGDFDQFTVTRATTATRVNASGLIESVASGLLRLDYPVTGGCPAALIEPAGTNVAFYSEQFSDAYWNKSAITVSGNFVGITAPDGTQTADKMIPTSASGVAHNINKTGFTSAAYTFSVFAKAGEESVLSLWLRSASVGAVFNLVSGTVVSNTTTSASIQNYGNGWYRCIVYDSTAGTTAHIYSRTGGGFTGNDVDGLYLWGAQLETGAIPTSYIPTTTASATRNADVCSVSGVSGYIGQTEGTLYAEVQINNFTANNRILAISNGTSDARVILQEAANSVIQGIVTTASADVASISTASGQTAGTYKIALAYKADDFAMYVNGTQIGTDSGGAVPACSQIFLGKIETSATTNQSGDRLRAAAIYTTRLTNDQLANLTRLT